MKPKFLNRQSVKIHGSLFAAILVPAAAHACACGCGIFDVGTSAMFPEGTGGEAFFSYAFQNQNQNWEGSFKSPAVNNNDRDIRTSFFSAGLQYIFNESWGMEAEIPFAYRSFTTVSAAPGNPVTTLKWASLGDIRLRGIYTGFSSDYSTGLELGVRLPTGTFDQENAYHDIDRDTQIGSGSTDLLLGGYHQGHLSLYDHLDWFAQGEFDIPVLTQGDYRPGAEFDAALGVDYTALGIGRLGISPVGQVLFSERLRDYGADANSANSGYTRVLLSPGVEFHLHPVKVYADFEVPVFQHTNGNQLVAPWMIKVQVSYMF